MLQIRRTGIEQARAAAALVGAVCGHSRNSAMPGVAVSGQPTRYCARIQVGSSMLANRQSRLDWAVLRFRTDGVREAAGGGRRRTPFAQTAKDLLGTTASVLTSRLRIGQPNPKPARADRRIVHIDDSILAAAKANYWVPPCIRSGNIAQSDAAGGLRRQ